MGKKQTLIEKIVSLIRFSFDKDVNESIASKIRHFYDIHFLLLDKECSDYIKSNNFKKDLNELIEHDKQVFDEPDGWKESDFKKSGLITEFEKVWEEVKSIYVKELTDLSYAEIPDEKEVKESFEKVIEILKIA